MNTISIDSDIYHGAEMYAKLHNISVKQLVENLLVKFQSSTKTQSADQQPLPSHIEKLGGCLAGVESEEFRNTLAFVKTKAAKGGKPVPANEKGLDALVDTKYKL